MKQNTEHMQSTVTLDIDEKAIFQVLENVTEGVARAFGSNCEVILHSLDDLRHSVVKIVNGHVTGRHIGSPMTDYGLKLLNEADSLVDDVVGVYNTKSDDGRLLKSVSILLRNSEGKIIGIMCINIDLSVPLLDFIKEFSTIADVSYEKAIEHFPSTLDDLVNETLESLRNDADIQAKLSHSEKNKAIVMELYRRGMFRVAGAVDLVAKKMGISRYTVYNYIREAKIKLTEQI